MTNYVGLDVSQKAKSLRGHVGLCASLAVQHADWL
jgi:hypothetical protein